MGWQTRLAGEVRMSVEAARRLLELQPVDWYRPGATFREYLGDAVAFDDARGALRFELGSVTWRLREMMQLIAAMKDVDGTDALVHDAPTYDAWYATGTFFVEIGRWGYVGAGPMFDVARGGYDHPAHVGPERPDVTDVRDWHLAGPLARRAQLSDDGVWLEVETVRDGRFRCGIWQLPAAMSLTTDVLGTAVIADGGANVVFVDGGRDVSVPVRSLYELREITPTPP